MLTINAALQARSSRWLPFAMLVLLHWALWLGIDNIWVRPLLLAHIGLFLMWQPLWRSETKLSWGNSAFIFAISLAALVWLNWWMLAFWVSGLFSLVGGRVFSFYSRWQRAHHLLMMAYLQAVLLLYIAPHLFGLPAFDEVANAMMHIGLPLLLVVMALMPVERTRTDAVQAVDFIYVLLLFTLLTLLVLGSLAFMTLEHVSYFDALLRTLFIIAIALLILGGLWNPRMGFSGLQASFSHYVLSIGTPLEEWLKQIAATAQQEQSPATFLERATSHLAEMPWIAGMVWVSDEGRGTQGGASPHRFELADEDLSITLFTRQAISPTVLLHLRLLVQVLGYFYQAKRREQRLREMTRQQTIYETGARLTHDLKNMLQSLFALTSIAQHDPAQAQPILQHQLPVLTQRIEALLAKLKAPGANDDMVEMPAATWWESLRQRHQHREIEWVYEAGDDNATSSSKLIPASMFDCVADNLIENASNKRLREPGIRITARFRAVPLSLQISDTGSAVPSNLAQRLLRTVVPSEDGLGVGLYQSVRWAQQTGCSLVLRENRAGNVCFELSQE